MGVFTLRDSRPACQPSLAVEWPEALLAASDQIATRPIAWLI
jgi:hypothetical protein